MRIVSADEIDRALAYPALIDALAEAFRADIAVPPRHHHAVAPSVPRAGADATLLLMPAWTGPQAAERFLGCKIVTVFPDNARSGRPSVYGSYFLMSGESGEPIAVLDGRTLTAWRTAAASALAARYLAREDAAHLVMVGAGALASHLVRAHACARPIRRVTLWNRTRSRAVALAFGLAVGGLEIEVTDDLESAVREADIVSCATLSAEPLVRGAWLKKGAHVDLVGGFTPTMREADDRAVKRARVYVDTRAGAMSEAGDIVQPIANGVISEADIRGDLFDLCGGTARGRTAAAQITLFKSVGTAIEDLAAAMLVWRCLA
jgi:ornithine cyclodeaminase/alanine dehydrogenase-like protein (mu-crystallin family)